MSTFTPFWNDRGAKFMGAIHNNHADAVKEALRMNAAGMTDISIFHSNALRQTRIETLDSYLANQAREQRHYVDTVVDL